MSKGRSRSFIGPTAVADTVLYVFDDMARDQTTDELKWQATRIRIADLNINHHKDDFDCILKWVQYVLSCDEVNAKAWIYDQITSCSR